MTKNHLATLEKYNRIEKLQAKAIHSQFLHVFSLYTDLTHSKWKKISLAGKVEAIMYLPEIQAPEWCSQGKKYIRACLCKLQQGFP